MTSAKLLLIEHKRPNTPSYSQALHKHRYDLTVVHSIKDALRDGKSNPPDLVVLDAASMRTSGRRMCRELRSALPHIPLLLICPNQNSPVPGGAADMILCPPFTSRKLLNRVHKLLPVTTGSWIAAGSIRLNTMLRRALEPDPEHPRYFKTIRGLGYLLETTS